ncbi:MAG: hypothetical protein AAGF33_18660, partial [Pseudomonadota bacterium]
VAKHGLTQGIEWSHNENTKPKTPTLALRLEAEAVSASLPHSFYTVLEAGHGFSAIPISSVTVDGVSILDVTFAFLEAHLLDGTPEYETRSVPLSGG